MQSRWFVYLVRCSDHTLFAGFTDDLDCELAEHNAGTGAPYTRLKGPVRLAHWERAPSKRVAQRRATELRALPKHQKERLVLGEGGSTLWKWDQIGGPQALGAAE